MKFLRLNILSVTNKLYSRGSGPSGRVVRHHELYLPGQPGRVMRNLAKNDSAPWRRAMRNRVRNVACPFPSVLRNLVATHLRTSPGTLCGCPRARPLWRPGSPGRRLSGSVAALRSLAVRPGDSAAGWPSGMAVRLSSRSVCGLVALGSTVARQCSAA